jgi:hypothetical protein
VSQVAAEDAAFEHDSSHIVRDIES